MSFVSFMKDMLLPTVLGLVLPPGRPSLNMPKSSRWPLKASKRPRKGHSVGLRNTWALYFYYRKALIFEQVEAVDVETATVVEHRCAWGLYALGVGVVVLAMLVGWILRLGVDCWMNIMNPYKVHI